jgi:hypothetical protein
MPLPRAAVHALIVLAAVALAGGCTSQAYTDRTEELARQFRAGHYIGAYGDAARLQASLDKGFRRDGRLGRDALVAQLEAGTVYRAAGRLDDSIEAFTRAEALVVQFDQQPVAKLTNEAGAALTNLTALPYRGTQYDRIMLAVYQALNYAERGEFQEARRWLRRAANRQIDAADKYRKQIQDEKASLAEDWQGRGGDASKFDADAYREEINEQRTVKLTQTDAPVVPQLAAYGDYQNPLVDFLRGVVFSTTGSDQEVGYNGFRRALGMVQASDYLPELVAWADNRADGITTEPRVFVVFEEGMAPVRDQIKIDVPLWAFHRDLANAGTPGIALPFLVYQDTTTGPIALETRTGRYVTEPLADVDSIVTQEFDNEFPLVLGKTLYITAVKALVAVGTNVAADEAAKEMGSTEGTLLRGLTRIGTSVYQYATNQADRRTWRTLPKRVHIAAIPVPDDGLIRLYTPGAGIASGTVIEVDPSVSHLVFAKRPSRSAPLSVRHVALDESSSAEFVASQP